MLGRCSPTLSDARKKSRRVGRRAPRRNETEWLTLALARAPSCCMHFGLPMAATEPRGEIDFYYIYLARL